MRLIDADKFKEFLSDLEIESKDIKEKFTFTLCLKKIIPKLMDDQTTAYDVEKVVEKLEEWTFNADIQYGDEDEDIMNTDIISSKNAIDIVRKGGVE